MLLVLDVLLPSFQFLFSGVKHQCGGWGLWSMHTCSVQVQVQMVTSLITLSLTVLVLWLLTYTIISATEMCSESGFRASWTVRIFPSAAASVFPFLFIIIF